MSELKYPNTPLQQLKKYAVNRMEGLKNIKNLNKYEADSREWQLIELEFLLYEINKVETQDQRQARDAENWSWRNGDDMGR